MNWQDIGETLLYAIVNSTVIAVVLKLIFEKSLDNLSNRLTQNHQLVLDKMLEDKKANNERKNYVSKVRFDKEFEIYQEISIRIFKVVSCIHLFSVNDFLNNDGTESDPYTNLLVNFGQMENAIYKQIAFMNKDIAEKCIAFHELATEIMFDYSNENRALREVENYSDYNKKYSDAKEQSPIIVNVKDFKLPEKSQKITDLYKEITDDIREYLQTLEVEEQQSKQRKNKNE